MIHARVPLAARPPVKGAPSRSLVGWHGQAQRGEFWICIENPPSGFGGCDETAVSVALWFPTWAPFIIFAAYPTIAFIRGPVRRWRRRRKGLCGRCGYNLTRNLSGMCPENGTEIQKS